MIIKRVTHGQIIHGRQARRIFSARRFFAAREGSASTELAFILGFIALITATGFVAMENKLTDNYTGLSERIEIAAVNMPNPLGSGNAGSNAGNSGGEETGGPGNGNAKGKNK